MNVPGAPSRYEGMRVWFALLACLIAGAALAPSAPAKAWTPGKPIYGVGEHKNVDVVMSDGIRLQAQFSLARVACRACYPTAPRT